MNNTVRCVNVRSDNLSVVDVHVALVKEHFHIFAFDSLDLLFVLEVSRVHGAEGNVVSKYIVEFLDVGGVEEVVKEGLGEFGESLVGGSENSEGTRAVEGVDKFASLEGSDKGGEVGGGYCKVDDGLASGSGTGSGAGSGAGSGITSSDVVNLNVEVTFGAFSPDFKVGDFPKEFSSGAVLGASERGISLGAAVVLLAAGVLVGAGASVAGPIVREVVKGDEYILEVSSAGHVEPGLEGTTPENGGLWYPFGSEG